MYTKRGVDLKILAKNIIFKYFPWFIESAKNIL